MAHHELAAALEDARDVTGDVAALLEHDADAAGELVHEWRGALFRVRLARRRLMRTPQPPRPVVEEPRTTALAAAALGLLATGTVGFLAGAVLVIWPLWAAGLALVAASLLVFRP
jgi:hypothetical protein